MSESNLTSISEPEKDEEYQSQEPKERTILHKSFSSWLCEPIREDVILEIELLVLAFGIGIQDATTYPDYFCFASNQTGNTVLFAIATSGLGRNVYLSNNAISLALFILGSWVTGQLGDLVGPRRRAWLLFSSFIQTAMVFAAAAIQFTTKTETSGTTARIVLTLLAFSSGSQVAMARSLKITDIAIAMVTAAYVDLTIDPKLFFRKNRHRNRRIAFVLSLTGGSFAGAYIHRGVNSPVALLVYAILKLVVTISFLFNKREDTKKVVELKTIGN